MTLLEQLEHVLTKMRAAGGEPTALHMHPDDLEDWLRPAVETWCRENGLGLVITEDAPRGRIYLFGPPDPDWLLGNKGR